MRVENSKNSNKKGVIYKVKKKKSDLNARKKL